MWAGHPLCGLRAHGRTRTIISHQQWQTCSILEGVSPRELDCMRGRLLNAGCPAEDVVTPLDFENESLSHRPGGLHLTTLAPVPRVCPHTMALYTYHVNARGREPRVLKTTKSAPVRFLHLQVVSHVTRLHGLCANHGISADAFQRLLCQLCCVVCCRRNS